MIVEFTSKYPELVDHFPNLDLNRVPRVGENIELRGLLFIVKEVTRKQSGKYELFVDFKRQDNKNIQNFINKSIVAKLEYAKEMKFIICPMLAIFAILCLFVAVEVFSISIDVFCLLMILPITCGVLSIMFFNRGNTLYKKYRD